MGELVRAALLPLARNGARDGDSDRLGMQGAAGDAVERLEHDVGAEGKRLATPCGGHGVVYDEDGAGLARRLGERADVGHAKAAAADGVHEPEQPVIAGARAVGVGRVPLLGASGSGMG